MMEMKKRVGRPVKENKEIKIAEHFMLSQETDAELREYAEMHGIPMAQVLEESIRAFVGGPQSERRLEIEKQIIDLKKELNSLKKNGGKNE